MKPQTCVGKGIPSSLFRDWYAEKTKGRQRDGHVCVKPQISALRARS